MWFNNGIKHFFWHLTWFSRIGSHNPCKECKKYRSYFNIHRDYPELCCECGMRKKEFNIENYYIERIEELIKSEQDINCPYSLDGKRFNQYGDKIYCEFCDGTGKMILHGILRKKEILKQIK